MGKDTATKYIRTYAPMLAGAILSWLATYDVVLDDEAKNLLVIGLTVLLQAGYYWFANFIGKAYPNIEKILLGSSKQPRY